MKTLDHLMFPTGSASSHNIIHYEHPNGLSTWCNSTIRVFTVIDGDRIRVWHHTRRPVDCKGCTKKMELHVAGLLGKLTAGQLEDIAAHAGTFLVKYAPSPLPAP
jgi:hypothetical protein